MSKQQRVSIQSSPPSQFVYSDTDTSVSVKTSDKTDSKSSPNKTEFTEEEEEENGSKELQIDLRTAEMTPLEFDIYIQTQRVLSILDETIDTLETVIWLPFIARKGRKFLKYYFTDDEVTFILTSCAPYISIDHSDQGSTEIALTIEDIHKTARHKNLTVVGTPLKRDPSKRSSTIQSPRNKLRKSSSLEEGATKSDPYIAYVIELICKNKALLNCLDKQSPLRDSDGIIFVQQIRRLRDLIEMKMSVTVTEEIAREKQLRLTWKSNTECLENIAKLSNQLLKQRADYTVQHQKSEILRGEYLDKISTLQTKFQEELHREIYESEKTMAEDNDDSAVKQNELKAEADEVNQRYEALLNENLKSEKKLRAKKFKAETQLASWLTKYDQDIGDNYAQLSQLQKEFDEETLHMNELQLKYNSQAVEYDELMAEKAEEERKIFEEKAYQFLLNRSARRIQRYWRAFRERKLARKRARKSKQKGGKKKQKSPPPPKKDDYESVRAQDPNALLEGKFKEEILQDVKSDFPPSEKTNF